MTIKNARDEAIKKLIHSPTAQLDADVLLSHTIKCSKSFLLAHRNDDLTDAQYGAFMSAIEKRKTGLAVAYITGHKEFYKLDFIVTQDVLVPKPDTETLVEKAVESIKEIVRNKTSNDPEAGRTAEAAKKNIEGRTDCRSVEKERRNDETKRRGTNRRYAPHRRYMHGKRLRRHRGSS